MSRLLIGVLGRRKALIACGVLLIIAGLIWGAAGSHQVTYVNSQQNVSYHIGTGTESGNVYINADGSSDYFVALSGDFNPPITQSDIDKSTDISFIARTDTTSVSLDANGTTVDEAHPIEKLVFYDNNGNVLGTHTTAEYTANPNGFYDNQWLKAIWLILIGLILGIAALVVPLLRKQSQISASPAATVGAQPFSPYQPYQQPDQYGQAYQGPQQYPQATQYPPQQPGYGQPGSNPYQQPPQQPEYGQPGNNPYQ
jgi:hypothetical protein